MEKRTKKIALNIYNYFRKVKPQNITVEMVDNYIFNVMKSNKEYPEFDIRGRISIWNDYIIYNYQDNRESKKVSKEVAQEYYLLVMMRKLAFMCMLYSEALFESITYGNIGCYRDSNYSRISEPPYENYMRQKYNDIIDNYNSYKQCDNLKTFRIFINGWNKEVIKQSPVMHLEDLLNEGKYIPTSSSTTSYYGTSVSINLPYFKLEDVDGYNGVFSFALRGEIDDIESSKDYVIKLRINLRKMENKVII